MAVFISFTFIALQYVLFGVVLPIINEKRCVMYVKAKVSDVHSYSINDPDSMLQSSENIYGTATYTYNGKTYKRKVTLTKKQSSIGLLIDPKHPRRFIVNDSRGRKNLRIILALCAGGSFFIGLCGLYASMC